MSAPASQRNGQMESPNACRPCGPASTTPTSVSTLDAVSVADERRKHRSRLAYTRYFMCRPGPVALLAACASRTRRPRGTQKLRAAPLHASLSDDELWCIRMGHERARAHRQRRPELAVARRKVGHSRADRHWRIGREKPQIERAKKRRLISANATKSAVRSAATRAVRRARAHRQRRPELAIARRKVGHSRVDRHWRIGSRSLKSSRANKRWLIEAAATKSPASRLIACDVR